MKRSKTMTIAFLVPASLAYLIVFLYPTVRTTFMSFFRVKNVTDTMAKWQFVGMENFTEVFHSTLFIRSIKNMIGIWVWGGIIVFTFSILLAVILTSGIKGKSFFRAVIYLPNVISAIAMGTMWTQYVYSPRYGLLKKVFEFFGLKSLAAIQWTAPNMLFVSMLIAFCFGAIGFFMLIFMAGIERIPVSFYEVGTIEGASNFKKFFKITLPLIKDVFRTNVVLWTISIVGFFTWSQVFSPLSPENGTVMPMVYMYQNVFGNSMIFQERNVGIGAAVGIIMTIVVIVMFVITSVLLKDKNDIEY